MSGIRVYLAGKANNIGYSDDLCATINPCGTTDLTPYLIVIWCIFSLGIAWYAKRIILFPILIIGGVIFGTRFTPTYISWTFASTVIVIQLFLFYIARKTEGNITT